MRKNVKQTRGGRYRKNSSRRRDTHIRASPSPRLAFYDSRVNEDLAVEEIVKKPILFFLAVMHHAVKRGRWSIVGHVPLNDGLEAPPKFIQDALNKSRFEIYYQDGQTRRATRHNTGRVPAFSAEGHRNDSLGNQALQQICNQRRCRV